MATRSASAQAWGVLETSRAPVRVFDAEALFTTAASGSKRWRDDRHVDDALIDRAMST